MMMRGYVLAIGFSISCALPIFAQNKADLTATAHSRSQQNMRIYLNNDYYIDGYIDKDQLAEKSSREFLTVKTGSGEFTIKTKDIKSIADRPNDTQPTVKRERIRLKNDSVLEGVKVGEDDKNIRLKIDNGEMLISKNDICSSEVIQTRRKMKVEPAKTKVEGIELISENEKPKEAKKEGAVEWPEYDWPLDKKVSRLIELLENPDKKIAYGADGAMGRLKSIGTPAVPFLVDKMDSSNPNLLNAICVLLVDIKSYQTITYLKKRLADKDAVIRSKAVAILERLGDTEARPFIRQSLKDESPDVRSQAIWAISNLEDTEALPDLVRTISDKDASVRMNVKNVLPRLYGSEHNSAADKREVINILKEFLDGKDATIKADAALLLGKLNCLDAQYDLIKLLSDDNKDVRANAASALAELRSRDAVESVIRRLEAEKDDEVKMQLLNALKPAKAEEAVPSIIEVMQKGDKALKRACDDTLRSITGMALGEDPDEWEKWWKEKHSKR